MFRIKKVNFILLVVALAVSLFLRILPAFLLSADSFSDDQKKTTKSYWQDEKKDAYILGYEGYQLPVKVAYYLPLFIMALTLVLLFYFLQTLGMGGINIGGFFVILTFWSVPVVLSKTTVGWAGLEPYNIFFSLLITYLIFLSFNTRLTTIGRTILIIGAGISIGLFSFISEVWWILLDLILEVKLELELILLKIFYTLLRLHINNYII